MPEDRSPRQRPDRQTSQPARAPQQRRWGLVFAGLSLILVAMATYGVLRSPLLTVHHVRVIGADSLDVNDLVALSGLAGKSMFDLPEKEAGQRLLALPQVKTIAFQRDWPQGLTIRLQEREPVAIWSVGGHDYAVDIDGIVLGNAPSGQLPRIIEPDSNRTMGPGDQVHPDALALALKINEESPRFLGQGVQQLEYRAAIGVTAVFFNGMRVTFGDERAYDYKVAVLSKLLDSLQARNYVPRDVDLRFGERVTYD